MHVTDIDNLGPLLFLKARFVYAIGGNGKNCARTPAIPQINLQETDADQLF